jgi:hypothetical protein
MVVHCTVLYYYLLYTVIYNMFRLAVYRTYFDIHSVISRDTIQIKYYLKFVIYDLCF